jgi:hypothetical protein
MQKEVENGIEKDHLDKCRNTVYEAFLELTEANADNDYEEAFSACICVLTISLRDVARMFLPSVEEDDFRHFLNKIMKRFSMVEKLNCKGLDKDQLEEVIQKMNATIEELKNK